MTSTDHDLGQFARLVDALEPWLDRVLFIGGWAHRLFRERPEAARLSYPPLRTGDVDVALDPRALERDAGIRERLAASGFREEFLGDDRPPVTHYSLGDEASGFYVEFLSPLLGGDRRRDGSRDVTERIAGVTAQKLRYLDILLVEPWTVTIGEEQGVPLGASGGDPDSQPSQLRGPETADLAQDAGGKIAPKTHSTSTTPLSCLRRISKPCMPSSWSGSLPRSPDRRASRFGGKRRRTTRSPT